MSFGGDREVSFGGDREVSFGEGREVSFGEGREVREDDSCPSRGRQAWICLVNPPSRRANSTWVCGAAERDSRAVKAASAAAINRRSSSLPAKEEGHW